MVSLVEQAEELLARMTAGEKASLLQAIARDIGNTFPGVERIEGIAGGAACIVRTRIPVWTLEQSRRLGMNEADILRSFPPLRAEDLVNAWAYVRAHRDEIDHEIVENESA